LDAGGLRGRREIIVEKAGKPVVTRQVQFADVRFEPKDFDSREGSVKAKMSIDGLRGLVDPLALVLYTRYHLFGSKFAVQEAIFASQSIKRSQLRMRFRTGIDSQAIRFTIRQTDVDASGAVTVNIKLWCEMCRSKVLPFAVTSDPKINTPWSSF
jgi:hypothetical protein